MATNVVNQKVQNYFLTVQCPLTLVFTLILEQSLLSTFFRSNIAFECLKLLLFVGTRVQVFSLNSVKTQVKTGARSRNLKGKLAS